MKLKTLGLSLLSAMAMSAGAHAADYELTVPHVTNIESYNHQSLLVFKNFVENHSNGAIKVNIYPSGQLCSTARECLSGVQAGTFDYFPDDHSGIGQLLGAGWCLRSALYAA